MNNVKKKISVYLVLVLAVAFSCIYIDIFAASIGQELTSPETGWSRFDDNNSNITFMGSWSEDSYSSCYGGSYHYTAENNASFQFNFTGTCIRIISPTNPNNNSNNIQVMIDGEVVGTYSTKILSGTQVLVYEKTGLSNGEHSIVITNMVSAYTSIDSIDLEENSTINPYNPNCISTPSNLDIVASKDKVEISWSVVTDATSYKVKRATTTGGPYTTIAETVTESTYTDTAVVNGTTYYYVVSAVKDTVESINSVQVSATPYVGSVSLLNYEGLDGSKDIIDKCGKVWTVYGDAKISTTNKKVGESSLYLDGNGDYISTTNSADFAFGINDFTIEFWVMPSVANIDSLGKGLISTQNWTLYFNKSNQIYFYNGTINQSAGSIITGEFSHIALVRKDSSLKLYINGTLGATWTDSSNYSTNTALSIGYQLPSISLEYFNGYIDEVHISKGIARYTENFTPPTVPQKPTNINVTATNNQVTLSWDSVTGATSYKVKRATSTGGPYTTIAETVAINTYLDITSANGTEYYYVISAVNGSGEGENSDEVSATPQIAGPTNVKAQAGDGQVTITWDAVANATGYNVKYSTKSSGPYAVLVNNITDTTIIDYDALNNVTYYYVVSAILPEGESANSHEVDATPVHVGSARAIIAFTMTNGMHKEYDMTLDEVAQFLEWYNNATSGTGSMYYIIPKTDIGPYLKKNDYIIYSKILYFEINEYYR